MNFHLFIDHWFVDDFIRTAEQLAPGSNRFIFTFASPAKHVSSKGEFAPYGSPELRSVTASIAPGDRVYVHWFSPPVMEIVQALPASTKLLLVFWGGDFLSFTERFDRMNHDPLTRKYQRSQARSVMNRLLRAPLTEVRKIRNERRHRQAEIRVRKEFMQRLNYFCHWNRRDMDDVVAEYGGAPTYLHFYYGGGLSDIPGPTPRTPAGEALNVWLGNSDTPANNHLDALQLLSRYQPEHIRILCPLSYGFGSYGDAVDRQGVTIFHDKWKSFRKLVPLTEYLEIQRNVDVVVMHHNRSQASGNIIAFLKMGKKLFLKRQSNIFELLKENGIKVFDANEIGRMTFERFAEPLTPQEVESNSRLITDLFSETGKLEGFRRILTA